MKGSLGGAPLGIPTPEGGGEKGSLGGPPAGVNRLGCTAFCGGCEGGVAGGCDCGGSGVEAGADSDKLSNGEASNGESTSGAAGEAS